MPRRRGHPAGAVSVEAGVAVPLFRCFFPDFNTLAALYKSGLGVLYRFRCTPVRQLGAPSLRHPGPQGE